MMSRPLAIAAMLVIATVMVATAQTIPDGWVEETGTKVEGMGGRSYLDTSSIHRGEDGLVYFNESVGLSRPDEIGKKGFMNDAYDCAKDIKYMCIGGSDWRNDPKSAIHTAADPALPIYRKYLCGGSPARFSDDR